MYVDPPMENNLGDGSSLVVDQHNPSMERPRDPGNVNSCVQLYLGFHISMSPLLLPMAKRKSLEANCVDEDECENAVDVIV